MSERQIAEEYREMAKLAQELADEEERRLIVAYIEKKIPITPDNPTYLVPDYLWAQIRKAILSGNYRGIEVGNDR